MMVAPAGQTPLLCGAVRALHKLRPDVHVVHEALHAVENVAPIGETNERLDGRRPIQLHAELEVVRAANHRHVVVHLEPRVVILHGNEERQAEAVLAAEIDTGVRQGAALARQAGAHVVARAVFARELESRFVQRLPAEIVVFNCRLTVLEKSRSMALALRPHCSTSKVPFGCLE